MTRGLRSVLPFVLLLAGWLPDLRSADVPASCETAGDVCKVVPGTKKVRKVVYSTKEEPYCQRKTGLKAWLARKGCGKEEGATDCPDCKGPYRRRILVKTEIVVEEPTLKCVVEKADCKAR